MKKIFYSFLAVTLGALSLVSCNSDTDIEAGGTAVEKMAGNWVVSMDAIAADGSLVEEAYVDKGQTIYTYNTAANLSTEMWLDDFENLWSGYFPYYQKLEVDTKIKVDVDYNNLTFQTNGVVGGVTITNGKILLGQGHNLHGKANDSIYFEIKIEGDTWPAGDGFDRYRVTGVKYDGFYE